MVPDVAHGLTNDWFSHRTQRSRYLECSLEGGMSQKETGNWLLTCRVDQDQIDTKPTMFLKAMYCQ